MMDKPEEKYIRLQKRIAMGDPDALAMGNFDVGPLDRVKPASSKPGATVMSESERNAPVGGNQANPNHGDM